MGVHIGNAIANSKHDAFNNLSLENIKKGKSSVLSIRSIRVTVATVR